MTGRWPLDRWTGGWRGDARVGWSLAALTAIALSGALAWLRAPDGTILNPQGLAVLSRALGELRSPQLDPAFLRITAEAALITFGYAVVGSTLSVMIGAIGGLLASRTFWSVALPARQERAWREMGWLLTRVGLAIPRGLHEAIWGVLLLLIFGLDPLVAVLAIAVPYGAITAKVFSELLDEVPEAPRIALQSAGASPLAALIYGTVPAALPDLVSYAFYRFECSIRAAAVLGIVGAGGLGDQLRLSMQSLRFDEMWTLVGALMILNGLVDLWSARVRRRIGRGATPRMRLIAHDDDGSDQGRHRRGAGAAAGHGHGAVTPPPILQPRSLRDLLLWLGALAGSLYWLEPDLGRLVHRAPGEAFRLASSAWPPAMQSFGIQRWATEIASTLAMSVLGITIALLLAGVLAWPAARNLTVARLDGAPSGGGPVRRLVGWAAYGAARLALLFLRSVPAPVWALLAIFVLFPGVLPGALALGLYTAGIVGRLTAEVIENADPRPVSALVNSGSPLTSAVAYALVPQVFTRFIAYGVYRWEECLRATAVVGIVGAGGLGRLLEEQRTSFDFDGMAATVLVLVILTVCVDLISATMRAHLRGGPNSR